MTRSDPTPLEVLTEGLNRSLFTDFRERCDFLRKIKFKIGDKEFEPIRECDHPDNKLREERRVQGESLTNVVLPNCFLEGCPIFERLPLAHGPKQACDAYLDRLGKGTS